MNIGLVGDPGGYANRSSRLAARLGMERRRRGVRKYSLTLPSRFFVAVLALALPAAAAEPPEDPRAIIQRAFELDERNQETARDYTFHERVEERSFGGQDALKSSKSKTFDVTLLDGSAYRRLIARNDQPLSAKDEKKEQRKLDKSIEKLRDESEKQRAKRLREEEKERKERREFASEIAGAFVFRIVAEESVKGADCWVIEGTPRAAYEPKSRRTKFLKKLRGKVWIAKADYGWVKADIETIDGVSFGWFLLRLKKGARMRFEQSRVNDEVWMLDTFRLRFQAKLGLLKGFNREIVSQWTEFRKFQTESKIITSGELTE